MAKKGKFKSGRLLLDGTKPVKVYDKLLTEESLDIDIWHGYYKRTFLGSYDWNVECDEFGVKHVSFKMADYVVFYERVDVYEVKLDSYLPFTTFLEGLRHKVQVSDENAKERLLSMLDYILDEWKKGKYV